MLRITADLSLLSRTERNYVADFIRNYPNATAPVEAVEDDADEDGAAIIQSFSVAEEADETTAEEAFGAATEVVASNVMPFPAPTPAPVAQTSSLDSKGLPWDPRIHTSTRAMNADGTWRRKRGVDDATVATVENELRAVMDIPAAPVASNPTPAVAPATIAPVTAEVAPVPPPPPAAQTFSYIDLIHRASELITSGKLTQSQLDAAVQSTGVPSLALLSNRLDLVSAVMAELEKVAVSA